MPDVRPLLRRAYEHAETNSADPNTRIGTVLVQNGRPLVFGTNKFPQGVVATPERLVRPVKYDYMEHAERAVIYSAAKLGIATSDVMMIATWAACKDCARAIVESGIRCLITHKQARDNGPDSWTESVRIGDGILREAGVRLILWDGIVEGCVNLLGGRYWHP